MAANPDMLQWQFQTGTENRAHASELNEEQMAQMAAMEAGNFYPSEQTTPELPELNLEDYYSQVESLMESVNELMSGFGESITENLTSAFEGVGEIFSTFGESITEGLTSTFEGAGEIFSTFGEGITEGLTSTFEGAGEIFSQFGELVTQGLTAAQESATSSLEAINTAFTSTKEQIQSSWAELPAFFSGIFDGLGGVAAAAGSAIEAGLTAPIGSIIAAWSSAAATISSIISSISAQAAAMPSIPSGGGLPAHAEGGFITSPEIALIGEKGAELILPLTDRERSMELLGESGLLDSQTAVLGTSTEKSSESGGDIQINLGGITFNVSGNVENLKENLQEFADEIAAHISAAVQNQFKNQCLE